MKKSSVTKLLIGFHLVIFGATFLRIDTFPLTWVPMYSLFEGKDILTVPLGDKEKLRKGFEITTAAGETEYINRKDLNIHGSAFRRIYTERAFGKGSAKHMRERYNLNSISDAMFNKFYPDPATSIDWDSRIINMINATLEREPTDPDYVVKVVASYEFTNISRADRRRGDLSNLNVEMRTKVMTHKGMSGDTP